MPRVLLTPAAKFDLSEIWSFVEAEARSQRPGDYPAAADRLLESIDRALDSLARLPLMGKAFSESPELRFFPVGYYLVFYRPCRTGIEVARVLHTARNIRPNDFL